MGVSGWVIGWVREQSASAKKGLKLCIDVST